MPNTSEVKFQYTQYSANNYISCSKSEKVHMTILVKTAATSQFKM